MIARRHQVLVCLPVLLGLARLLPQHAVELLFASDYFPGQITATNGEHWHGLFPAGSGWVLDTTTIHVEPVTAGCIQGGKRVTVDRREHPLLLVRGVKGLRTGPIDAASVSHAKIMPGHSTPFSFGGDRYRFVAVGAAGADVREYELRLADLDRGTSQSIVAFHGSKDMNPMAWPPEIIWVGDIDRDGKPDLFADLKMFETPGKWVLYLSSAAGRGELVRKAVEFDGVDC